jgi:hypothetical protein
MRSLHRLRYVGGRSAPNAPDNAPVDRRTGHQVSLAGRNAQTFEITHTVAAVLSMSAIAAAGLRSLAPAMTKT